MIGSNLFWKLGLATILVFWLLISFTDYPAPFIDDAFYVGAAINLAQHGVFSNPYCEMLAMIGATDHFFANMPLHDYVLAAWLKIFGVSTLSFHVFYTLLAAAVSCLIYHLFPVSRFSWLAAIFISLAVYGLLGSAGLRSDSLGLFFLLLGFDAWRAKTVFQFFWKNVFLGLTVITFPNVALFAMLLSLAALLHFKFFQQRSFAQLFPLVCAMGAAYLACFFLFLWCIDGRLTEFLSCMVRNQQLSAMGVHDRFQLFTALGLSKWVVVQISFLILILALMGKWRNAPQKRENLFFLALALLVFGGLTISSASSASGAHVWAFCCLMAGLFIIVHEKWKFPAWIFYTVIFAIAAFGHAHVAIQHALADSLPSPEKRAAWRQEIDQMHPPRLYVDAYAMRELYDYRLPSQTFAFETSNTKTWGNPTSNENLPTNSVSVVSVERAFATPRSPDIGSEARPLKIFGHKVANVVGNPYDLEIMDNRD